MKGRLTLQNANAAISNAGMSSYRILWELQGRRCFHCSKEIAGSAHRHRRNPKGWTRDHVIPKGQQGGWYDNIVLSCWKCNHRKGQKKPVDFDLRLTRILWSVYRHFVKNEPPMNTRRYAA